MGRNLDMERLQLEMLSVYEQKWEGNERVNRRVLLIFKRVIRQYTFLSPYKHSLQKRNETSTIITKVAKHFQLQTSTKNMKIKENI